MNTNIGCFSIRKSLLLVYICVLIIYSLIYYYLGSRYITIRDDSYVDSLYFSSTIMSTVGFGDIVPVSDSDIGKLVVISHQLITIIIAGILITDIIG